ncbi:MAG TPA: DUF2089 domain-containing protein [Anaeromyxobacter sp.]|nr:DUF2089 domain-containing protein [Anaeromyxobacter sp.]
MADWKDLSRLANGERIVVERVRFEPSGIALEGSFELPPLAQLPMEDQVFVGAFVRSHGSIKEMERLFGVSYPTVKNRLNRLSQLLGSALGVEDGPDEETRRAEVLDRLERGEIDARRAAEELRR